MNTVPGSVRPRRRWLRPVLVILALVLLAGGGWFAWAKWFGNGNPADQYVFAAVQRGDIEDVVTATGTLQPRDYVDVGAQVSGQLKKIHVEVGSEVTAGDLLAEIDPTVLQSKVDATRALLRNQRAQLMERESNLLLAESLHRRQVNLMAEDATTAEALQNAEAVLRAAKAQIEALKAQIDQSESNLRADEANLNYTRIYAPFAGTVVSITARTGQTLNTNQSAPIILRIADLSTMTVQTQVSEADVTRLKVGMDAYFTTLGNPNQRWYGRLSQIEPTPTVTNNVVLFNALFDVPNPDRTLMTQMTAQAFFVVASARDVLTVPASALTMDGPRRRTGSGASAPGTPAPGAAKPSAAAGKPVSGNATSNNATPAKPAADAARAAHPASAPRTATVKVLDAKGNIEERRVTVGIGNRVQAQIVDGLEEGTQVVTGQRQPAGQRRAAGMPGGIPPGAGRR